MLQAEAEVVLEAGEIFRIFVGAASVAGGTEEIFGAGEGFLEEVGAGYLISKIFTRTKSYFRRGGGRTVRTLFNKN